MRHKLILETKGMADFMLGTGAPLGLISPQTFVLPSLGPKLSEARKQLYHGIGFFVLRGLKPSKYNSRLNTIIYAGLASYVGSQRGIQYDNSPVLSKSLKHLDQ